MNIVSSNQFDPKYDDGTSLVTGTFRNVLKHLSLEGLESLEIVLITKIYNLIFKTGTMTISPFLEDGCLVKYFLNF